MKNNEVLVYYKNTRLFSIISSPWCKFLSLKSLILILLLAWGNSGSYSFDFSGDKFPNTENDIEIDLSTLSASLPNPDMVIIEIPNDKGFK